MQTWSLRRSVTAKAALIGVVVLLLLVPLSMLRSLVSERTQMRQQAYDKVAEGWGGSTTVGGPILIVPTERTIVDNNNVTRTVQSELYLLPRALNVSAALNLEREPRHVGMYDVPIYLASVQMTGHFDMDALEPFLHRDGTTYFWDRSRIRLPLAEVRTLREIRQARLQSLELKFSPGATSIYPGVDARVDLSSPAAHAELAFAFDFTVAGSQDFGILPTGTTTQAQLKSNWPHPAFQGAFLPVQHSIGQQGFDAHWQVLELNRNYSEAWQAGDVTPDALVQSRFGTELFQSVDAYQRTERAIKYALLFIALTFMTFFAWEQVSGTKLHPLQYLLVGLALSTFYLLLLALSEHLSFWGAYAIAAGALVALITVYVSGVVDPRRGSIVGGAIAVIYALLYVLIRSEDYALLIGSIVLFAVLAIVMISTRRVQWYALAAASDE